MLATGEVLLAPRSDLLQLTNGKSHAKSNEHQPAAQLIQRSNELNELFEKKFEYQKNGNSAWRLPESTEVFKEFYQIEELQCLRSRMNEVKSKLNNYGIEEWSAHTRRKDPAGEVPWRLKTETKAEFVTVAWCKFFECLNRFPIVKRPKLNSLHLCEAPGAFIAALNHYLNTKYKDNYDQIKWKWLSTTLNPYYEGNPLNKMIADDRFLLFTLDHWIFHEDFTGNIMDVNNIESLKRKCSDYFDNEDVHLITADGSIDCISAPDCQEENVDNLNYAEILTALSILSENGCFVIKFFTQFQATSVCKMFLLNCVFDSVNVFKPATSKRGNSEIYVVCVGFKKNTPNFKEILEIMKTKLNANETILPLFARRDLPKDFLFQHEICQRLFMNLQIKAIENNIFTYEIKTRYDNKYSHLLRTEVCNEYYNRYHIIPIPRERTMLYGSDIPMSEKMMMYKGSHSERELLKATGKEEQVFKLQSNINDLEKSISTKYGIVFHENSSKNLQEKTNLTLKFYTGSPILLLHNSSFLSISVLFMLIKFKEIFELDPLWSHSPCCDFGEDEPKLKFEFYKAKEDLSLLQQNFFVEILNQLIAKKPNKIIFRDFLFITHYSVSILRFLYLKVFKALTIQTEPEFEVILDGFLDDDENSQLLEDLRDKLKADNRILCVLDIPKLHRNEFSTALIEFNNLLAIRNSNRILTPLH